MDKKIVIGAILIAAVVLYALFFTSSKSPINDINAQSGVTGYSCSNQSQLSATGSIITNSTTNKSCQVSLEEAGSYLNVIESVTKNKIEGTKYFVKNVEPNCDEEIGQKAFLVANQDEVFSCMGMYTG